MNQSFGIMDQGYFISRSEILKWLNDLLQVFIFHKININKIEQLGTGAIYCQILDSIFPGKLPMNKVNWNAKLQYQFINNLKILQTAFDKLGISKKIPIEKLAKAKYQDNLQFIQWFKKFYDSNGGSNTNYEPVERRSKILKGINSQHRLKLTFIEHNDNKKSVHLGDTGRRKSKMHRTFIGLNKQNLLNNSMCNEKEIIIEKAKKILMENITDSKKVQLMHKLLKIEYNDQQRKIINIKDVQTCNSENQDQEIL